MNISLSEFFAQDDDYKPKSPLEAIFSEEPVPLDIFIKDRKFLGQSNITLSDVQSDAIKHIERIYYPELYPQMAKEFNSAYWAEPIPVRNLISILWGKGSGKDAVARWSSLRVAYLLLCLKSPQEYFGLPGSDSIHLLNIASSAGQANLAFFKPMTVAVRNGWFADKAEPKQGMIQYAKNIEAVSGHSDAEGQEGLNLILGVADEIDAFKAKEEMMGQGRRLRESSTSAESILDMLKTSASSRFPETYKRIAISYPRYKGSTIMKLVDEGRASNERYGEKSIHFVSGPLATWEVNPRISGKDAFAEDYDKDPVGSAAKYECKPTRATDAYFRNMDLIRSAVDQDFQPIQVEYELKPMRSTKTGVITNVWDPTFIFADWFKPIQGAIYAMHGDLAVKGDRAGIAMSHIIRYEETEEVVFNEEGEPITSSTMSPVIRNDFTIAFEADLTQHPSREIQIRWARKLAFELIKRGFLIQRFTFDGFQSTDSMQILSSHGIESQRVSADLNDDCWKTLRDLAYSQRLRMADNDLLFQEIEALSKVGRGKVDHPPAGSKDLADAFACSLMGAIVVGGEEDAEGKLIETGESVFTAGPSALDLEGTEDLTNIIGSPLELPVGYGGELGDPFNGFY